MSVEAAQQVRDTATLVHDADAVRDAIARTAVAVDVALRDRAPILMPVLNGGLYFAGQLLPLLDFPLQQASVHVSRYHQDAPGALAWHARPNIDVSGRSVLLIDDVFDEGLTLAAVVEAVLEMGAESVQSAVLVNKAVAKKTEFKPEFVALECGPEYLFGCGMDCQGFWRNLPAIYAAAP